MNSNKRKTELKSNLGTDNEFVYCSTHEVWGSPHTEGFLKGIMFDDHGGMHNPNDGCVIVPHPPEIVPKDKPEDIPKKPSQLAVFIENLRARILGDAIAPISYASEEALYEDLLDFYETTLSLDPLTAYLLASYTLLTHQLPNLDFIFELYITGINGTGKSILGERLEKLCYQAYKTGCATFAALVRANEILNGRTQVLDEFDLIADDDHVIKYLRGSSDRNNPYFVVENVTIGGVTQSMPSIKMSFGPRILITGMPIKDDMVRDRAIEVVMMQHHGFLPEPSGEDIRRLKGQLAEYRNRVCIRPTLDDMRKYYDPKHLTPRLNEAATLLYMVTPEKHHDKIKAIIDREWEARTALERESYAAKIVESLTAAVLANDIVEAPLGEIYVPIQEIKHHYDLRYSDNQTGKGKTSPKSIGRVTSNLGLKTDNIRVKGEGEQRLRAWRLDKDELVRTRQTLYLDDLPDLGTSGTSGTSHRESTESSSNTKVSTHTIADVPNVPIVPKPAYS